MTSVSLQLQPFLMPARIAWLPAAVCVRLFLKFAACVTVVLMAFLMPAVAHADNCSSYRGQVWLNEYFFGSGGNAPPNFLEIYTTLSTFPALWNNWSVDVYSAQNTTTTYTFTTSNSTACTVANKTWLTQTVPGGLRQQNALVVLKDSSGKYVDAFAFDNNAPPAPWSSSSSNWFPGLSNSTTGCPALATSLDTQAGNSSATAKQANMLVLGNYGNKDMARDPDGGTVWDLTSNTGSGTTFTQCVSNNTNFTKTVDNTTPTPGSTVTFTLNLANTSSNTPLSGVSISDTLPSGLTYISATPSNAADPVPASPSANILTWNPASVASGTTSKLYVKMQVPSNAVTGTTYTNTAQTTTLASNQIDYATITVGSANAPSFAFSVTPSSSTTCTPAQYAPKVTITAMSQANGGGSVLTSYNGTATLTASSPNVKWYNSSFVALTGNTVTFTNGVATLYLTDTVAETVTVSAFDFTTYSTTMTGSSGSIIYTGTTRALTVADGDTLTPGYGVVAGRPHKVTATVSNCGAPDTSISGSLSSTIYYATGLNNPGSAAAPRVSTSSSCTSPVTLSTSTSGSSITLTYTSGVATFYLCTTDVGQYALNLTSNGWNGVSSNFTVRPFVVTATGFTADSTTTVSNQGKVNPAASSATPGAFTTAGSGFTGTFQAWRWLSSADANSDGSPDSGVTAAAITSGNPGTTASFSGTTNYAGVVSVTPSTTSSTTGTLSPTSATLSSGIASTSFTYSEVGTITLGGGSSGYAAINYLGAAGVNVPLLSDTIGRFTPHRFAVSTTSANLSLTPRKDNSNCSSSSFTYLDEPFEFGVKLTAQNLNGATTTNYAGSFAMLNPSTATSTSLTTNSLGIGAVSGTTALTNRITLNSITSAGWSSGSNVYTVNMTVQRGSTVDGPFNSASIGFAPTDSDGVTLSTANIDLDADLNNAKERMTLYSHKLRFGRLKLFNVFGSANSLTMDMQAQYWTGNSWLQNTDDGCTGKVFTNAMVGLSSYLSSTGSSTTSWTATVAPLRASSWNSNGTGTLVLTRTPSSATGTVDVCFQLGSGSSCASSSANMSYLQDRSAITATYTTNPSARASFGIYSPEQARTIHVREIF